MESEIAMGLVEVSVKLKRLITECCLHLNFGSCLIPGFMTAARECQGDNQGRRVAACLVI